MIKQKTTITESININGITYRKRYRFCNNSRCTTCIKAHSPEEAHGPYIEKGWREGKKMKWLHVRKNEVKNIHRPIEQIAYDIIGVQTNLMDAIQKTTKP